MSSEKESGNDKKKFDVASAIGKTAGALYGLSPIGLRKPKIKKGGFFDRIRKSFSGEDEIDETTNPRSRTTVEGKE